VGRQFPVGTLVVKVSGAFLLGLLVGLGIGGRTMLLAGTATLGSYTIFSTWMLESHRLGEDGELRLAGANLAVSLLVGVAAAAVGWALGGRCERRLPQAHHLLRRARQDRPQVPG
jgi:fluoride exporter